MPITTNKPVNFISFSIVLLVIMGLCICIAPDTAYAVDQEPALPPADGFAPSFYVACPRPSESDSQGWVAVSDGRQVRVFIVSYTLGATPITTGSHVVLEDINVSDKKITISFYGNLSGELIVSRFDSDGPSYGLIGRHSTGTSEARTYNTWVTPTYVAFGGCVNFAETSGSVKSFVPIFDDNGYNQLYDVENYLYSLEYDVEAMRTLLQNIHNEYTYEGGTADDVEEIRADTQDMLNNLSLIKTQLTLLSDSVAGSITSFASGQTAQNVYLNPDINSELFSVLDELSLKLSALDSLTGLSDSIDRLNQVVAQMQDSFTQISQDLQELTAAIEAETDYWEMGMSDFGFEEAYKSSRSPFDFFSSIFSGFKNRAFSFNIWSYSLPSLDPGSSPGHSYSTTTFFNQLFFQNLDMFGDFGLSHFYSLVEEVP